MNIMLRRRYASLIIVCMGSIAFAESSTSKTQAVAKTQSKQVVPDKTKSVASSSAAIKTDSKTVKSDSTKDTSRDETSDRLLQLPSEKSNEYIGTLLKILKGDISALSKESSVQIFKLIGAKLSELAILPATAKFFNNDFTIRNIQILESPKAKDIIAGLGITGTTNFNQVPVKAVVFVVQIAGPKMGFSATIELPQNYKISSLFPSFKKLDDIPLPNGKLIFSSFGYKDPSGFKVEKGLNYVATLSLEGPLKALGDLRKKAGTVPALVFDVESPMYFRGVISGMTSASFEGVVPLRLGIDFTKNPNISKGFSDFINKINTDDIIVEASFSPKTQSIGGQTGVQIKFGSLPNPIRFDAFGSIESTGKITFGGKVPDTIHFKWFSIGDLGIEFDIDPAVQVILASVGIPISGFGIRGKMEFGKEEGGKRASLDVAGKLSLEAKKAADFALDLTARDIQFAKLFHLLSGMSKDAKPIPTEKLPVLNVNLLKGKIIPTDTTIAGKKYSAGFQLALDIEFLSQKLGFNVEILEKELTFKGIGYLNNMELKGPAGKSIMKISGPGLDKKYGTGDDGPVVSCAFNARKPEEGSFLIKAKLEIPALAIKGDVDFEYINNHFKADIESSAVGVGVDFGISIAPKNMHDTYIRFGFKADFSKYLSEQAIPAIKAWQKEVTEKAAKIDAKIGEIADDLKKLAEKREAAKKRGIDKTNAEIKRTDATIKRINKKIQNLKNECGALKNEGKVGWRAKCAKIGIEIGAQYTALGAQEAYKEALLKPGKKVITGTLDTAGKVNEAFQDASKAIADAKIFQKTLNGIVNGLTTALDGIAKGLNIFKVTDARGEVNVGDLIQGKSPKLIILKMEVNIPGLKSKSIELKDLQFDFKNFGKTIKNAIDAAFKKIKKKEAKDEPSFKDSYDIDDAMDKVLLFSKTTQTEAKPSAKPEDTTENLSSAIQNITDQFAKPASQSNAAAAADAAQKAALQLKQQALANQGAVKSNSIKSSTSNVKSIAK